VYVCLCILAVDNGPLINLVNTPIMDGEAFKLLNVDVVMVRVSVATLLHFILSAEWFRMLLPRCYLSCGASIVFNALTLGWTTGKAMIGRVVVLCPTRHKIGHFGDVLPSSSLGLVLY